MMDGPIHVGIVGSRFAAEFHYEAYQRVTGIDVNVVGVTSVTRENREKFAKERGIKAFNPLMRCFPRWMWWTIVPRDTPMNQSLSPPLKPESMW